jgi:uncharacterized repeat protein (TIGR03809 family)
MTNSTQFVFSQDILARGRMLAEGRMAFLTELYESGRWRRYHSEADFLAMVRESRAALDKWTELAVPPPVVPTAAKMAVPKPLPSMFGLSEATPDEVADDPLAATLAAISMEMGMTEMGMDQPEWTSF